MAASPPSRYLQFLPAIFQDQPAVEGQPSLGQFLAPFESQFDLFEQKLAEVDRDLTTALAPADFLPWLAGWVAHLFDEAWDEDRQRRFLATAMELYRWRGTVCGLQRYLELWFDLEPGTVEIREGRWPGGMQIGVASRVGYPDQTGTVSAGLPQPGATAAPAASLSQHAHDYYAVKTVTPTDPPTDETLPPGERIEIYYDADFVQRIDLLKNEDGNPAGVRLSYMKRDPASDKRTPCVVTHLPLPDLAADPKPRAARDISRRDGLIEFHFTPCGDETKSITGGTLLVSDIACPYRFIVDIRYRSRPPAHERAAAQPTEAERDKAVQDEIEKLARQVRAVLDAEKPAHTEYYLRITPEADHAAPDFMRIGVSSIGLDTTIA